jgi:hypothetical protein
LWALACLLREKSMMNTKLRLVAMSFALLTGGVLRSQTIYNRVLNLNGTDACVQLPNAALNNISAGTIETWLYLRRNDSGTITSKQHDFVNTYAVFSIGYDIEQYNAGLGTQVPGRLYFHPRNGSVATSNGAVGVGAWHHVALVFTGSSVKFYIDGVLDNTVSGNFYVANDISAWSLVGALAAHGGAVKLYIDGLMDNFRIWNRALSDAEVHAAMGTTFSSNESGLLLQWSFNDGTAADSSANGFNGTLQGGATILTADVSTFPFITTPDTGTAFGSIHVGGTRDLTFTIKNPGGTTVSGTSSVAAPFSVVSGDSYTLTPGQSKTVTVRFSPIASGAYSAYLMFGNGSSWLLTGSAYADFTAATGAIAGIVTDLVTHQPINGVTIGIGSFTSGEVCPFAITGGSGAQAGSYRITGLTRTRIIRSTRQPQAKIIISIKSLTSPSWLGRLRRSTLRSPRFLRPANHQSCHHRIHRWCW